MKKSRHIFIDGTYIHPFNYIQTIVVLFIDEITNLKVPGLFALLSNKSYNDYKYLFLLIKDYIFDINNNKTITIDFEEPLIKAIHEISPNDRIIGCYFHFKNDLYKKTQKIHLTNKNNIKKPRN